MAHTPLGGRLAVHWRTFFGSRDCLDSKWNTRAQNGVTGEDGDKGTQRATPSGRDVWSIFPVFSACDFLMF